MTEEPFRTVSLGDWLDLARKAAVPHVPATEVCEVAIDDILYYDTPGSHEARLAEAWKTMEAARRPRTMFRWDCCASDTLKHLMAHGRTPKVLDLQSLYIDSRLYELAGEYPGDTLKLWRRPWIRDRMVIEDGYPVEYRVFVHEGEIQGISSYYPQRPLRLRQSEIDAVRKLAERLAAKLTGPLSWPATIANHPDVPADRNATGTAGVHASMDFVITHDEGALLLEGGPPHFAGAHPCCFKEGRIAGIALAAAPTATKED